MREEAKQGNENDDERRSKSVGETREKKGGGESKKIFRSVNLNPHKA